ncbi:MAG: C10 family peptidase [Planctomycetes bacterium]|nr:C10 family peptidase [Planctomycetota bacterium]
MRIVTVIVVAGFLFIAEPVARAELATPEEMRLVCQEWLAYMVHQQGSWAGSTEPKIVDVQELTTGDTVAAHCFAIAPQGYVVVPVLKELPPIKAYSEEGSLDPTLSEGLPQLLREVFEHRLNLFVARYGSLEAAQPRSGDVLFDRKNREQWNRFQVEPAQFKADLERGEFAPLAEVGPLLTSAWHQDTPYNIHCPIGDYGYNTAVGCVATAIAQIMKYHEWPPNGVGSYSYYWFGDYSCGGATYGQQLSASFSDAYAWASMPDLIVRNSSDDGWIDEHGDPVGTTEMQAVSELCYEVGVAHLMNYGVCASGTRTEYAMTILPRYFRYAPTMELLLRNHYTAAEWFSLIQAELNAGRPMLYTITYHAIVCDGWRDTGGESQYHMNYGWSDTSYSTWYAVDGLFCPWEGCDPLAEDLIRNIKPLPPADCNDNAVMDHLDIWSGTSTDCNGNAVPDECDIDDGTSADCQPDGVPDECQLRGVVTIPDDGPCAPTATTGAPWCDDFESYSVGSIQGLNGWQGWGAGAGDPAAAGNVSTEANRTPGGMKSLKIEDHDTVHIFNGYDSSVSQHWILRVRTMIPSSMSGSAFLIIMPDYTGGGPGSTWGAQIEMSAQAGRLQCDEVFTSVPLVTDEWAEIRLEINLEYDEAAVFYNDDLLGVYQWSIGGGSASIGAIDLYGPGSDGAFFDDVSLFPTAGIDCNTNGKPDDCDLGDYDGDGALSLSDFAGLADCLTGPCAAPVCDPPLYADSCCAIADIDHDGDHDLADMAVFFAELTGS